MKANTEPDAADAAQIAAIEVEGARARGAEQTAPRVSIAIGFVYAEKIGSGDVFVFRFEKTDQVGGFAARKSRCSTMLIQLRTYSSGSE